MIMITFIVTMYDNYNYRYEMNIIITEFYIHGSVHRESNLITVQQDATYSVHYISIGCSTCCTSPY